ncbi:hypothetical protein ACF0H5_006899 [Mactra antiquata]
MVPMINFPRICGTNETFLEFVVPMKNFPRICGTDENFPRTCGTNGKVCQNTKRLYHAYRIKLTEHEQSADIFCKEYNENIKVMKSVNRNVLTDVCSVYIYQFG